MAPRLRSAPRREREAALNAGPVNTRGLPALPVELLREIVSHTTTAPIPCSTHHPLSVDCLERSTTLRALSQLCRTLRSALLPILWERIEACTTTTVGVTTTGLQDPRWFKDIATDLIAQLETVTVREPSLMAYVRIVNVLITPFSADTVLTKLARCLALMPNLHTIQIINLRGFVFVSRYEVRPIANLYQKAFAGYQFPSVRSIILPPDMTVLLPCFPEARSVYMNANASRKFLEVLPWDHSYNWLRIYVEKLSSHCQKVESFAWTHDNCTSSTFKSHVYQMLPGLRQVRIFSSFETVESLNSLYELRNLDTILLTISEEDELENPGQMERIIAAAQAVLASSLSNKDKVLVVERSNRIDIFKSA